MDAKFESLDKDADGRLSKEELSSDSGLSGSFSHNDKAVADAGPAHEVIETQPLGTTILKCDRSDARVWGQT